MYKPFTSDKMRRLQQGKSKAEANKLSVALELQADFYAGVWTLQPENE
jgi:predicted metalloprotease